MNEQKHTPLPWQASHNTGSTMQGYSQSSCVVGTGANRLKIVAGCFKDIGGEEVAAANAALIVRAVNSHDKLVAALKAMMESYEGNLPDHCNADWFEEYRLAQAAIAAAEAQ